MFNVNSMAKASGFSSNAASAKEAEAKGIETLASKATLFPGKGKR